MSTPSSPSRSAPCFSASAPPSSPCSAARQCLPQWRYCSSTGARDQFAELLAIRERVLGAEHPNTLTARANLAYMAGLAGDPAAARDQFADLFPAYIRVLGTEHPDTLTTRVHLARMTGHLYSIR